MIFHRGYYSLVSNWQTSLAVTGYTPNMNEGVSSFHCLNYKKVSLSWYLRVYFTVATSLAVEVFWVGGEELGSFLENCFGT